MIGHGRWARGRRERWGWKVRKKVLLFSLVLLLLLLSSCDGVIPPSRRSFCLENPIYLWSSESDSATRGGSVLPSASIYISIISTTSV